jgi:acyl-CoA thioester hydrolase
MQSIYKPPADAFGISIQVQRSDIDLLGHVNNIVYLKWVQDLAVAHWHEMANPDDIEKMVWVVVRHEIDYKRAAKLGDEIAALTWVGKPKRRSFERYSQFRRGTDNKVLAQALTIWSPLDRKTMSAIDVSESIRDRFTVSQSSS